MIFSRFATKKNFSRTFSKPLKNHPNVLNFKKLKQEIVPSEQKLYLFQDLNPQNLQNPNFLNEYFRISLSLQNTKEEIFETLLKQPNDIPIQYYFKFLLDNHHFEDILKFYKRLYLLNRTNNYIFGVYFRVLAQDQDIYSIFNVIINYKGEYQERIIVILIVRLKTSHVSIIKEFLFQILPKSTLKLVSKHYINFIDYLKTKEDIIYIISERKTNEEGFNLFISKAIYKLLLLDEIDTAFSLLQKYSKFVIYFENYFHLYKYYLDREESLELAKSVLELFLKAPFHHQRDVKFSIILKESLESIHLKNLINYFFEKIINDPTLNEKEAPYRILLNYVILQDLKRDELKQLYSKLKVIDEAWTFEYLLEISLIIGNIDEIYRSLMLCKSKKIRISFSQLEKCFFLFLNDKPIYVNPFFEKFSDFNVEKDERYLYFMNKNLKMIHKLDINKIVDELIENMNQITE